MKHPPHDASTTWLQPFNRVLSLPFLGAIKLYQWGISPLLPSTCIHKPSCSYYGLTAMRRFGPIVGLLLITLRVLRCHPWAERYYDPVPQTLSWGYFKRNPFTGRFFPGASIPLSASPKEPHRSCC